MKASNKLLLIVSTALGITPASACLNYYVGSLTAAFNLSGGNGINLECEKDDVIDNLTHVKINLDSTVTNAVNANNTRIQTAQAGVNANYTRVQTAQAGVNANYSRTQSNLGKINQNTTDIATNKSNIATNLSNINKNNVGVATNKNNIASNLSKIQTNKTKIGINSQNLDILGNSVAQTLGGNAKYNSDKSISMSNIGGTGKDSVDLAIAHVNQGYYYTVLSSENGIAISDGSLDQIQPGETITYNASKNIKITQSDNQLSVSTLDNVVFDSAVIGGINIDSAGVNANNKKITNVKPGSITKGSRDVVTGAQVHKLASSIATVFSDRAVVKNGTVYVNNIGGTGQNTLDSAVGYVNKRVDNVEKQLKQNTKALERKINEVSNQSRAGIAAVAAMSALGSPSKACGNAISVAMGAHQNENAIALGYTSRSCSGNWLVKINAAVDSQNQTTVAGSTTYEW